MLMLQVADPAIRTGASWGGGEEKDQNTDGKQTGSRKKDEDDAVSCYQPLINSTTSRGTAGAWRVLSCILLCSALLLLLYISGALPFSFSSSVCSIRTLALCMFQTCQHLPATLTLMHCLRVHYRYSKRNAVNQHNAVTWSRNKVVPTNMLQQKSSRCLITVVIG